MSGRAIAAERPELAVRRAALRKTLAKKLGTDPLAVAFVALFSAVVVGVASLLDAGCVFELGYGLRVSAALLYLVALVWFLRARVVQAMAAGALVWMLLVLPHVRWNYVKSFYVDARRIDVGMTVAEVREIMRPYLELRGGALVDGDGRVRHAPAAGEEEWGPWREERDDGLLFLHSLVGYTDACEVDLDARGKVLAVRTVKD